MPLTLTPATVSADLHRARLMLRDALTTLDAVISHTHPLRALDVHRAATADEIARAGTFLARAADNAATLLADAAEPLDAGSARRAA